MARFRHKLWLLVAAELGFTSVLNICLARKLKHIKFRVEGALSFLLSFLKTFNGGASVGVLGVSRVFGHSAVAAEGVLLVVVDLVKKELVINAKYLVLEQGLVRLAVVLVWVR